MHCFMVVTWLSGEGNVTLVMTKSGKILRREVRKWHENVFDFKTFESLLGSASADDKHTEQDCKDVPKTTPAALPSSTSTTGKTSRPSGQAREVSATSVSPPDTRRSHDGGDDIKTKRTKRARKIPDRMGFVPGLDSLHELEHLNYTSEDPGQDNNTEETKDEKSIVSDD